MTATGIEAVLFDMDGTLFDSERIWDVSLAELARKLGGELSPAARHRLVGSNLLRTVRMVQDDLGVEEDDRLLADWLLERTCELFAAGVPWRPGARSLVESVRSRGIPTALVTTSYRVLVDVTLAEIPAGMFEFTVCGDEVEHPKPHPEPYLTAAAALGVDPGHGIAIEDSLNGITSAVRAGCLTVAVPEEPTTLPDPHGAVVMALDDVTVDGLAALLSGRRRHDEPEGVDS
ncbi:haloacid dehalogenase [Actinocatenispora thailandica]|uniref:Haloacid dehalogenase n=1 Tax=Actinocatenispora thailandica TaxID=227318 RepID=A0A7R7DJL8_9ACTN|nr:HAD family phosphatase [Actinocatenispora thailandica]BCJ32627.1 haloacid dehalogenase [Actinocatenispora thailandica]